jgi:lincosamide nucleotidyltransferase B/F
LQTQTLMIERLRYLCQDDERVIAAMLYGSFVTGEADAFSDIECAIFFDTQTFSTINLREWVEQIAPVSLFFADDFGHFTTIFDNLVRGEFHFEPIENIAKVSTWKGNAWFPSSEAAILVDSTGALSCYIQPLIGPPPKRDTLATAEKLISHFINLILFGTDTLERGELGRSLELLSMGHRYLLRMARLIERATLHWPSPTKGLEHDLSVETYQRFVSCTARLNKEELHQAYRMAWTWGAEMANILMQRHSLTLPETLFNRISSRLMNVTR